MGGTTPNSPDTGATMQLDAVVDDMEDFEVPEGLEGAMSAPPPLPPKKAGKGVWVIGGLVVLISTVAAVGIGLYVMSTPSETAAVATQEPAPAEPEEATPEEATPEEPAATDEAEDHAPHVVMDEFVFDHEGEEPSE